MTCKTDLVLPPLGSKFSHHEADCTNLINGTDPGQLIIEGINNRNKPNSVTHTLMTKCTHKKVHRKKTSSSNIFYFSEDNNCYSYKTTKTYNATKQNIEVPY